MPRSSQRDYRNIELDPDLLLKHFTIQTRWCVISGASCSGKTTLIDQLADKDFHTAPEVARQYFERELAQGREIDEVREDRAALTSQLYELMLESERRLDTREVTFLDRGLPDALSFYRFAGLNPNEILPDCFLHRYACVLMLNRLPYQRDGVRAGDDKSADYFESWTSRDYTALGYNVMWVPVLPPEERLAYVLEKLSEQGLN